MSPSRFITAMVWVSSCTGNKDASDRGSNLLAPPDGFGDPCHDDTDCTPSLRCLLDTSIRSLQNTCVIPCGSSGSGTSAVLVDETLCRETYGPCYQCIAGATPPYCDFGFCLD